MKQRLFHKDISLKRNSTAYLLRLLHPHIYRHYQELISEDDLVFDVGANVGELTHVFSDLGAHVIAVEPQRYCVEILKKRFGINKNVEIYKKGLSDSIGNMRFYVCSQNTISTFSETWMSESRFSGQHWTEEVIVPTVTLDHMISLFGTPKFCKIDVEGYEFHVLQGLSSPIPYISFEFVSEFLDQAQKCMDYLTTLGSVRFNVSLFCFYTFCFRKWLSSEKLMERISKIAPFYLSGDIYARFE